MTEIDRLVFAAFGICLAIPLLLWLALLIAAFRDRD